MTRYGPEVEGEVLTPRFVEHVLDGAFASGRDPDRVALEVERDRVPQEAEAPPSEHPLPLS